MKRKLLEITEIDCGDETCDRCHELSSAGVRCIRLDECLVWGKGDGPLRCQKCHEAERLMKQADDAVALQNIRAGNFTVIDDTTTKKAQGPPDSIGE